MSAPRSGTRQYATRENTTIAFTKASACGNDFLIIEGTQTDGGDASFDLSAISRQLCDRHRGVGADGVEWLFPDVEADVMARLINADGSEAEISGNGTRCVAADDPSFALCDGCGEQTPAGAPFCAAMSSSAFASVSATSMLAR